MNQRVAVLAVITLCLAACRGPGGASQPINAPSPVVLVVTPTTAPTRVPTVAPATATLELEAAPTATDAPAISDRDSGSCADSLLALYTGAGESCLGAAANHFCNGAAARDVDGLDSPGSLASAAVIDSVELPPLTAEDGGLVWLRLDDSLRLNALIIGGMHLRDATANDGSLPPWSSLIVRSQNNDSCEDAPKRGALVAQSVYGQTARVAINGVSAAIKGTVVVQTIGDIAAFSAIEGRVELLSHGHTHRLHAGEQLDFRYAGGDWLRPAEAPGAPKLLDYDLVRYLPVALFPRPLPIPQPGYAQTQGGVNMRAGPDINARLLFQVPAGETMNTLGISKDGEWLHIRLGNGETGWMSAPLLAKTLGEIRHIYDETPQPPQRYGDLAKRAYVNAPAGGNLREAPDTAFRIRRTLPYGARLSLIARSPYSPWVKVDTGTVSGWMALFTLRTQAVISSLPVDYTVPFPPRATAAPVFKYGGGHAYPDPEGGY